MNASVMFLDCPEHMDDHGTVRCGLPAAVEYRYTVESTSGPLESAKIRCPRGHGFNGPVEALTWSGADQPAPELGEHVRETAVLGRGSARAGNRVPGAAGDG